MSEKTMVTIDCDLTIPEEAEKVFENQHIRLSGKISCSGKLVFKNCEIEPLIVANSDSFYAPVCIDGSKGTIEMDGCTVIRPRRRFLELSSQCVCNIRDTAFYLESVSDSYKGEIISGSGHLQVVNCYFEEKTPDLMPESSTSAPHLTDFSLKDKIYMSHCVFKNLKTVFDTDIVENCSFTNCAGVKCNQISDSTFCKYERISCPKISASTFTDGGDVIANEGYIISGFPTVGDGYVRDCIFDRLDALLAESEIDNCKFCKIENDEENKGTICVAGKVSHCTFDDVDLQNNSYLIIGYGDFSVEDCQFINCRTDREDLEVYIQGERLDARIKEQEKRNRGGFGKGLLRGALSLLGSAARSATGVALDIAQEAGDMDKFKKRYEEEQKKFEREQHKQK